MQHVHNNIDHYFDNSDICCCTLTVINRVFSLRVLTSRRLLEFVAHRRPRCGTARGGHRASRPIFPLATRFTKTGGAQPPPLTAMVHDGRRLAKSRNPQCLVGNPNDAGGATRGGGGPTRMAQRGAAAAVVCAVDASAPRIGDGGRNWWPAERRRPDGRLRVHDRGGGLSRMRGWQRPAAVLEGWTPAAGAGGGGGVAWRWLGTGGRARTERRRGIRGRRRGPFRRAPTSAEPTRTRIPPSSPPSPSLARRPAHSLHPPRGGCEGV